MWPSSWPRKVKEEEERQYRLEGGADADVDDAEDDEAVQSRRWSPSDFSRKDTSETPRCDETGIKEKGCTPRGSKTLQRRENRLAERRTAVLLC